MFSTSVVYPFGNSGSITVPASGKISVKSEGGEVKVYQVTSYQKFPSSKTLLATIGDNEEYTSSAFSGGATLEVEAAEAKAYYSVGTAPVVLVDKACAYQGAPGALNATGTLTAALVMGGIVTSTTAAGVTATLDTGAVMDAASTFAIGDSFDWSVVNTGPNTFTVTASTGHTVVGAGAVATATSGLFRTRKTAADTFITYRLG